MGIPVKLITGLDEKDAYRLAGNSVSNALDQVLGPIAQELIDDDILQERIKDHIANRPEARREAQCDHSDSDKNTIVADCLKLQMWNRVKSLTEITEPEQCNNIEGLPVNQWQSTEGSTSATCLQHVNITREMVTNLNAEGEHQEIEKVTSE